MNVELALTVRARSTRGNMKEIGEIVRRADGTYRFSPHRLERQFHGAETLALIVKTLAALNA